MHSTTDETIALLATEWFKACRRALKLVSDSDPARASREKALADYAVRRVEQALAGHAIRLHTFDGQPYSPALPAEPVNPEDFDSEEGLMITETLEPTILRDGQILLRGKVVLKKAAG